MKLDELQSVQSRERQTDKLQQLRSTFYEEAGQFVAQLREERSRAAERADDPFDSPEVNRLTDDIKTAEQTVEAIYERRVGKIVKMASLAAADMPTEDDGLTREERTLFETMVEAIEGNRQHVLDVVSGEAPTGAVGDGETATESRETEVGVDAADIMGGDPDEVAGETPDRPETPDQPETHDRSDTPRESPPAGDSPPESDPAEHPPEAALSAMGEDGPASDGGEGGKEDGDVDRKTVRITDEVGEIFGVDQREYDLSTDDVVTLPADNADPLVERDAAEPLE
jgi:DNA replication factor GINS